MLANKATKFFFISFFLVLVLQHKGWVQRHMKTGCGPRQLVCCRGPSFTPWAQETSLLRMTAGTPRAESIFLLTAASQLQAQVGAYLVFIE